MLSTGETFAAMEAASTLCFEFVFCFQRVYPCNLDIARYVSIKFLLRLEKPNIISDRALHIPFKLVFNDLEERSDSARRVCFSRSFDRHRPSENARAGAFTPALLK